MSSTTKQISELLPGNVIKFSDAGDDSDYTVVKVTSGGKFVCMSNTGMLILDPSDRVVDIVGRKKVTVNMLRLAKAFENGLGL